MIYIYIYISYLRLPPTKRILYPFKLLKILNYIDAQIDKNNEHN